jgi:AcrR family transcriptional regulator
MNRQPEVCARTRADFERAFWKLYCDHDIDEIKVQAIANVAGHNRSTFYKYYEDIYDLRDQAEKSLLVAMCAHCEQSLANCDDVDYATVEAASYEHFGTYFAKLFGPNGDPDFQRSYHELVRSICGRLYGLSEDDPRTDVMCECVIGAFTQAISYWYRTGKPISSQELADMLLALLHRGILHAWRSTADEGDAPQNGQAAGPGASATAPAAKGDAPARA